MLKKLSLFALLLSGVASFSPSIHPVSTRLSTISRKVPASRLSDGSLPDDIQKKVTDLIDGFDLGSITGSIKSNVMDGNFGERGEVYTAVQFALIFFIAIGGIPILGTPMMLLLGPVLSVAGVGLIALSVNDLGDSLSPWPTVPSGATLKTEGIYEEVRHPMYAGVVAVMAGISILTGSANRLLLTAALLYALELKTEKEEEELLDAFPEYAEYKAKVSGKFVPARLLDKLPWGN